MPFTRSHWISPDLTYLLNHTHTLTLTLALTLSLSLSLLPCQHTTPPPKGPPPMSLPPPFRGKSSRSTATG